MRNDAPRSLATCLLAAACLVLAACGTGNRGPASHTQPVDGQLHWRGIYQNGNSPQTGLPTSVALEGGDANLRWPLDCWCSTQKEA